MKRAVFAVLILLVFLVLFPSVKISAAENGFEVTADRNSVKRGETVELSLSFDGTENIGAFLAHVEYGSLEYKNTEAAGGDYTQSYDNGETTASVFTLKRGNSLSGNVFTWSYRVPEDTADELLNFTVRLSGIVDTDGAECMEDLELTATVEVAPLPSSDAGLLELSPSDGEFDEAFSADIFYYTMSVPYDIRQLNFDWICSDGATTVINRKNLGSGGSVSRFLITVTAADGESKTTYTVDVTRGAYVRPTVSPDDDGSETPKASPKPTASPRPTVSPKPTKTPKPTASPKPAATPKAKATPKASKSTGSASKTTSSKSASAKNGTAAASGYPQESDAYDTNADGFTVPDNYTESSPLIVKSDSVLPYVAGIASGIAAISVGALAAVVLMRKPARRNKHEKEPEDDSKK